MGGSFIGERYADVHIWEISGGSSGQRESLARTRKWQQPLRTDQGIYVVVNRLRPRCYRFAHAGDHVEHREEIVDFPLMTGVPGFEICPPETVRYAITNHVTRAALEGEVAYRQFQKGAGVGRIIIADGTVLEGMLLDVPMFIRDR